MLLRLLARLDQLGFVRTPSGTINCRTLQHVNRKIYFCESLSEAEACKAGKNICCLLFVLT